MSFTPLATEFQDENMSQPMSSASSSKKRKRLTERSPSKETLKRTSLAATNGNAEHSPNSSDADISNTAAAALSAHLSEARGLSFGSTGSGPEDRQLDESFGMDSTQNHSSRGYTYSPTQPTPNGSSQKHPVGSDEWHRVRRDNHKEVERRRRETINEGINELAKIVPGCEKNKGSILARAVSYITDLKSRQELATEQKSMEKSVLEQAVNELMSRNEELKDRNRSLEDRLKELESQLGRGSDNGADE